MKILQVILALSTLILIHEAGHFTFAKLFGIRVDKFYLFFDFGGFKLLSTKSGWFSKLFPSLKNLSTEYGIGWMPLGGYCKISGMIDESMDTDFVETEPKPWEFRSKKAWQRLLVMAGGVMYNFIFAILIYSTILSIWGESYISNSDTKIYVNELAYDMGFRNGDHIISFDDFYPEDFGMLQADLARKDVRKVTLERGTDTVSLYIDRSRIDEILNSPGMFNVAIPFVVDSIPPSSPNVGSGLLKGDRICAIEGSEIDFIQDSRLVLSSFCGAQVNATILRGADTLQMPLVVDSTGRVDIFAAMPNIRTKTYGILESIPAGARQTVEAIGGYVDDLKMVATPSTGAYKSVGSFIAIGQVFPSKWNWFGFLSILALLSIMLGVINLLPIPGLDGGHILFTLFEMLTGRKPSEKFLIGAQMVGMFLLMMLMFLAFGNDISRLLR